MVQNLGGLVPQSQTEIVLYHKRRSMGRPTEEKKGKVVKVRVSDEVYEELENQNGSISEVVRGYIQDGLSGESGKKVVKKTQKEGFVPQKTEPEIKPRENFVPQNIISDETLRDIGQMCQLSGLTTVRFFDRVRELFDEGMIYVEGIQVKTKGKYDVAQLEEVCHRLNADPQEMIDRLTKSLMRG